MVRFYFSEPRNLVLKAKQRRKSSRTYKRVSALSRQMSKAVQVDFVTGIKSFKKKISANKMYEAWKSGNYNSVLKEMPWQNLHEDLDPAFKKISGSFEGAANYTIQSMPAPMQDTLRFDAKNPFIRKWINERTGSLVQNIQSETQEIIQNAIVRTFTHAQDPRKVANQIRDHIGLNERYSIALMNYREKLEQSGKHNIGQINNLTDAYYDRLLDARAMTIARTETRFASNQGQLAVWNQAANDGLIDRATSKKVWYVDGAPCEICEPMDGIAVPLDGFWNLPDGSVVDNPTDAHPNCMCGMELEFNEEPAKDIYE
jgi:hypothetical protein